MYSSDVGLMRAEATPVLVMALANDKSDLGDDMIQQARQVILQALQDPSEAVRIDTVRSLSNFGKEDMIPALKAVAQTDPSPDENYYIRRHAAEAIAAIQQREGQK